MNNKFPLVLALIFLLTAVLIQVYFSVHHFDIVPSTFNGSIVPYSDSSLVTANGGYSEIFVDSTTDQGLYYRYRLNESYDYYYAGVQFYLPKAQNVKQYSHVKIDIDGGRSSSLRFFLLTNEPGISQKEYATTWRHHREFISTRDRKGTYDLELATFNTPQWWYETYSTSEPLLREDPLLELLGVKVESGEGEPTDAMEHIVIQRIRFYTPVPSLFRSLQTALVILSFLLLAFRFGIMKRVQLGKYKPVVLGNLFDADLDAITNYIGEKYSDSDLSLGDVALACNMHHDKVTALVRQGYGQTFKQYLNRLRLTEAQRLLRETDRQISEIAFAVGYNSVSHFNRVFKQFFSCTPREYRV
ncbi:MAG: helix-turn-helix transcriptional regulator [Candidatus Brocadiaceae bacterium]|nr:helix-turn-helix transcriptional regulator [Candidatus Brocadiaceae bacterium]